MKKTLKLRLFCTLLVLLTLVFSACAEAVQAVNIVSEVAESVLAEKAPGQPGTQNGTSPKSTKAPGPTAVPVPETTEAPVTEDGLYSSKEDVALYIHLYGHLPANFITKDEAEELGWSGGGLDRYAPGCSIGGDRFGNREGLLPKAKGRTYTECDIDTMGARSRGAKRIVFSNDGLIYYTEDHYASFTLLYGEDVL